MVKEHGVKIYPTYQEALEVAKRENKIVMVEGFITYCRGCIKMDREVFIDDRVKKALERDFVVTKDKWFKEEETCPPWVLKVLPLGNLPIPFPNF